MYERLILALLFCILFVLNLILFHLVKIRKRLEKEEPEQRFKVDLGLSQFNSEELEMR